MALRGREAPMRLVTRGGRFAVVGALGFALQLGVLATLHAAGLHTVLATGIAVEAAILHNAAWHERWTWADRPAPGARQRGRRLFRFNLAAAIVSGPVNLAATFVLAEIWHAPLLAANAAAVALASIVTFLAADRAVFVAAEAHAGQRAVRTRWPNRPSADPSLP